MNSPSTTLYSFSFAHHGHYSSFHRLLHYAHEHRTIDITLPLPRFLNAEWKDRLTQHWRHWAEWRLRPIFARKQRQCVHYLYPENSLFRGGKWKGRHGLVLSCHQPPSLLDPSKKGGGKVFLDALNRADRVVLLTESFKSGYEPFCERSKLRVIPHGVDIHFFRPSEHPPKKPLVITVGNWLRDYKFWADAILKLADQMPYLQFAVVALPSVVGESFDKVKRHLGPRVRLLYGLSDEELRRLYQDASALFLPLKDAGANNALLEAMACGLPVIASDLPATREYAGDAGMFFAAQNVDECLMKLQSVLKDDSRRIDFSTRARRRAVEHFSWEIIAVQYARLYAEVLAS